MIRPIREVPVESVPGAKRTVDEVLKEIEKYGTTVPSTAKRGRTDLRDVDLVTIDGADARDFDDAVFAEPDPDHPDGWHLIVAIADVSWYVRPGDALDRSAYDRGNSVYFPDRVVPMLPHELSTGWCSLNPKEDRPCLIAHMWIDQDGNLKRHRFERALMRSAARLTYEQVQAAHDGQVDDTTDVLVKDVITPLYGAYAALSRNRQARGVLDLDMPERKVIIGDGGQVAEIAQRERLDSHKLIEEFMITANVAAAETLEKKSLPCMYRIHDQPSPTKIDALGEALSTINLSLAKGQVMQPRSFNQILTKARGGPFERMVQELVLRSQAQAEYSPDNIGHFGLALRRQLPFRQIERTHRKVRHVPPAFIDAEDQWLAWLILYIGKVRENQLRICRRVTPHAHAVTCAA